MENPLKNYFRQPSIYVKLPSKGKYYPAGAVSLSENNEVGVMPMTAKDELTIKTPDALLNGQATVDVIRSCVPDIKDPWSMPMMDVDTVMLAIRIASYGDTMEVNAPVPVVKEMMSLVVNLNELLDRVPAGEFDEHCVLSNGLHIRLMPRSYRMITNTQMKTFEEQRLMQTVSNSELSESEKISKFTKIFSNISALTVDNMTDMIVSVTTPDGNTVNDRLYIKDFVYNMDTNTAKEIQNHIDSQINIGRIPPITVQTESQFVEKGAPPTFETPITFDTANFFALSSFRSRTTK